MIVQFKLFQKALMLFASKFYLFIFYLRGRSFELKKFNDANEMLNRALHINPQF